MKLVKARYKKLSEMPPVELCCQAAIDIATKEIVKGQIVTVDLEDIGPYQRVGHCLQELGYKCAPMVIVNGEPAGRLPFELIDIDEGGAA